MYGCLILIWYYAVYILVINIDYHGNFLNII